MSAFVCDDKTINLLVAGLFHAKQHGGWNPYPAAYPQPDESLAAAMGDDPASFGRTLYCMNVNAVEQRYPDAIGNPDNLPGKIDDDDHHVPYHYAETWTAARPQFLKSLRCYLYQCSEGDVPKLPLYKLLTQYADDMAIQWAESLPEYEAAAWG